MGFLGFSFLDFIDILLVAFLLYQLYRLIKDTVAINVLIGVAAIYLVWKLVEALQMELLSEILGQFIGVGVIAVVIVFQQEIRRFLLMIGSTNFTRRKALLRWWRVQDDDSSQIDYREVVKACGAMTQTFTGALIVIEGDSKLGFYASTGTPIGAQVSGSLLESIFNKNSPLHDGAVIITGPKIVAAGCILPLTEKTNLPSRFGLRHRAALGISEKANALAIVVSEETGEISVVEKGQFRNKVSLEELQTILHPSN